jgi:hypothetical protein
MALLLKQFDVPPGSLKVLLKRFRGSSTNRRFA